MLSESYDEMRTFERELWAARSNLLVLHNRGPRPDSVAEPERRDPFAALAYRHADAALHSSLDHLVAVAAITGADSTPNFAVMSLLRVGFECALVAQWLLEVGITLDDRAGRGVAVHAEDLREKYNYMVALSDVTRPAPINEAESFLADASGRALTKFDKKGKLIPMTPLPGPTKLFEDFAGWVDSTTDVDGGQFDRNGTSFFRFLSAFAHGREWAHVAVSRIMMAGGHDGSEKAHAPAALVVPIMEHARIAAFTATSHYINLYGRRPQPANDS